MNIRPEQLDAALAKKLAALYVLVGDDWLQLDEARQSITRQARSEGVTERVRFEVEGRFDWSSLKSVGANLSLFAERRLVDLRIPGGKPGREGGEALKSLAARLSGSAERDGYPQDVLPEDIWVVSLPKLDKNAQKSVWFNALSQVGVTIQFWPIGLRELPRWIESRGAKIGLQIMPDAAQLIAERVEGNLLAAKQELDKLTLLNLPNPLTADMLLENMTDQSRFNPFDLGDALLNGDRPRTGHLLERLREEGVDAILILWVLSRELRLLAMLDEPSAIDRLPVPKGRRPAYARAARRAPTAYWLKLLGRCADIDRTIKGLAVGEPWQMLDRVALAACGKGSARHQ